MLKQVRKLYDWVLSWAETPYGTLILFLLAFAEASFFPIPPDVLLIALSLGLRSKSIYFALICSIGSIFGGISGYYIGHYLWFTGDSFTPFADFFFNNIPGFSKDIYFSIKEQYNIYGFLIIFTAGFTPIPYKIFTITAGAFNISFPLFLIASIVSRSARFFLISLLILKFGIRIRNFIDKYFNILSIIFTILLFAGYILIRYINI